MDDKNTNSSPVNETNKGQELAPSTPESGKEKRVLVTPDKVVVGKKKFTLSWTTKILMVLGGIALVLVLIANALQRNFFRGEDSLIFLSKGGLLNAPFGIFLLFAGAVALAVALKSLISRKGKLKTRQKLLVALVGLVLMVVGFSGFFRFVDYKENTIVDRSLLVTRAYTYLDVSEVNVSSNRVSDSETVLTYEYRMVNGRAFHVDVTGSNMMEIKKIDTKIRSTVKRSIDNFSIQEMERLGMYTQEEALRIFVIE